ncbi:MAG: Flp pilus assembly complex ATPase component TadA [Bdellovibrionaceae bacterium]|nr:Flp pilus assembly complex ATPase component TadA [Pseudobdellovibrionaceae bacterium]
MSSNKNIALQLGEEISSDNNAKQGSLKTTKPQGFRFENLVGLGILSGFIKKKPKALEQIKLFLKKYHNINFVKLTAFAIKPELIKLIPEATYIKYQVVPVEKIGSMLVVAAVDLLPEKIKSSIAYTSGMKVSIILCEGAELTSYGQKLYGSTIVNKSSTATLEAEGKSLALDNAESIELDLKVDSNASESAVIKFISDIIQVAIMENVSDIHFEVYEKIFRVRYRKDGVLLEKVRPPKSIALAAVSRLKIISGMDISEKRKPQDGRLKAKSENGKVVDFRVSALPTLFGEKIVLRLLDKTNLQVDMTKLGFIPSQLEQFQKAVAKPQGIVLVTGPTGSGKTTTLYSAVQTLNTEEKNISTAENPVEFNFEGINQVQVNPAIGFNFSDALRAFLRQDPEIIMIGEIRDLETAEIAYKASSTGHLVLSTLHTNDAPSSVSRLLDMGIPGYIVADSTSVIVAQRLVRTNCKFCLVAEEVNEQVLLSVGVKEKNLNQFKNLKKGRGCVRCNQTGFSGRSAVFEVLEFTSVLKKALIEGVKGDAFKKIALAEGFISLRQHALEKLAKGITTVREVLRVTIGDDEESM